MTIQTEHNYKRTDGSLNRQKSYDIEIRDMFQEPFKLIININDGSSEGRNTPVLMTLVES